MNVLFIYPNLGCSIGINTGISVLAGVLKQRNHRVKLIHLNETMGYPLDLQRIHRDVERFKPQLIGVSCTTNEFPAGLSVASYIKERIGGEVPIVFGGVHPTVSPEETLSHDCVDMVVVGEGEKAIVELAERIEKKQDISRINNLWFKSSEGVVKNKLNEFVDLTSVPFIDTDIWDFQKLIDLKNGFVDVLYNRGCPFNCSYCFNRNYKRIYSEYCRQGAAGNYQRAGDCAGTMAGLRRLLDRYANIRIISIIDDNFLLHPSSLTLAEAIKKEIGLPFVINSHLSLITEQILVKLREYGCDLIRAGIETGNEVLRKKILNRPLTDGRIIEKIRLIREHGIKVLTYNMIGLPTETREDVLKTMELNAVCRPDIVRCCIFYPYPGTDIYSTCKERGLLQDSSEHLYTLFEKSTLNFPAPHLLFLEKMQRHFDCYLNLYDRDLEDSYGAIVKKIENLSRRSWEEEETQQQIDAMKREVSRELGSRAIPHYRMKYTSFMAVRE